MRYRNDRRFTPALFRASYSGRQLEVRRLHPAGVTPCAARGILFTARVTFRAWPTQARAALFRAHDPTGVRDSGSRDSIIPRAPPFGRGRRTMVRCTARAAGARIARHAAIIFQRACPRDAVPEHAGHGRCDGRTRTGRAVAGRNRGRRCRSDRGRRQPGRDRVARPFARRRELAIPPPTLRACATPRAAPTSTA